MRPTVFLACLVVFAVFQHADALPLDSSSSSATGASSSAGSSSSSSNHSTSVARLIPLVVIPPLLVALFIGYMLRRRLGLFFKKFQHPPSASDAPETTSTGGPPVTVTPASASASTSTAALVPRTTGGITSSDRPVVDRRSRRRRRRSRDSVVGLPLYSEEPDDAEMTLFKSRPSFDSRFGESVDLLYDDADGSDTEEGGRDSTSLARPSIETSSSFFHGGRSRSASDAPSTASGSGYPYSSPLANAVEIIPSPPRPSAALLSPPSSNPSSIRAGGHRFTQSASSASVNDLSARPAQGRSRASTLRSIFTRNGSSTMLAGGDEPVVQGRSPYGQFGASRSTTRLATSSQLSVSSLNIGSPLTHTLVSSSFVFPKGGLSAQQVAFISSRESLGAFGYGPGTEPPAFDGADALRPTLSRTPSTTTRGRAGSFSSGTSPLRRHATRSPPSSPMVRSDSVRSGPPPAFDDPAAVPLHTSPTLPTSPTAVPLPLSPTSTELSSLSPTPSPAALPQLTVHDATPSHSTSPSPIIPAEHEQFFDSLFTHQRHDVSTISEASYVSEASTAAASFATARQQDDD